MEFPMYPKEDDDREQAERDRRELPLLRAVAEAAQVLHDKMQQIMDSDAYKAVWASAYVHGMPYQGENWCGEFAAIDSALAALAKAIKGESR